MWHTDVTNPCIYYPKTGNHCQFETGFHLRFKIQLSSGMLLENRTTTNNRHRSKPMMTNDWQPPRSLTVQWLQGAETIMTLHENIKQSARVLSTRLHYGHIVPHPRIYQIGLIMMSCLHYICLPFSAHIVVPERGSKPFHICSSLTHELGQTFQSSC